MIKLNSKLINNYVSNEELAMSQPIVDLAHKMVEEKTGAGNDFLGWVDLPLNYDVAEFAKIKETATKIINDSDVFNKKK